MTDTNQLQRLQRTILDNVAYGIISTTPDGIVTSFNPAAERLLGYAAEEIIGKQTPALWHDPEEIARHATKLSEELGDTVTPGFDVFAARPRRRLPEEGEWTFIRKDGARIPVNLSVTALWDENGHNTGFVGLIYDLTERKQAGKERMTYLHFFESMDAVNRSIQGAGDLEQMMSDVLDATLSIFDCDRAFLMFPCDPEAATWRVPMERNKPEYPGASSRGLEIPMDADVARTLRELLASDRPVKFGPETEHPLPDDIARQFGFLSFMSIAIYPKIGKPWQFGIHQCSYARVWTVDEEKLLREIGRRLADGLTSLLSYRELRTSEQLFRALVENSPDYIARYDREFHRIYVNPAIQKLFGGKPEEVLGKTPADRSPVYAPQVYVDRLRQVIDTGAECSAEIPFRTAMGEMHWGHMRFAPEFGADGAVASVLAIGRDIHEIKENERHFRMLAENFPDFVARFDRDGRYTYVNPAAEQAFGLPADAVIGKTPHELPGVRTAEQNDALLALIRRAFAEGVINESEAHWSLPTGERIVEIRQVPERDAAGEVISALSIAHDITQRKRAEEALQKSEALLNTAQRLTKVGGWEFDIKTGKSFWTEELYRIHEIPNDPGIDHLKESLACYGPEDRQIISEAFQRACEQGASYDLEFPFTTYTGKPLWIRTTAQPVYEEGKVVRLVGNLMDITERKRAEEALRESEAKYRRIVDMASEGIWALGPDTMTTFVNARMADMLGYSSAEMIGRPVTDFMFEEDVPDHLRRMENRRRGLQESYERRYRHKNGKAVWTLASATPVFDDKHRFMGANAMFTDITERKRVENALLFVAQSGWQTSGENFFHALAQFLGEELDMDYVLIDRIDENPEMAETVALYARGVITPNMRYALKGTPCENVMGRRLCVYSHGIQQLFPEDTLLPGMGAESYIGIPLWDSTGRPIGLIAVMGTKPLYDAAPVAQLLQLVATRAAAELEREQNDRLLREREHEFRTLAANLPDSIVRHDREGRVVYVNPVLEKTLGAEAARMLGKRIREMFPDGSYEVGARAVDAALATGENAEIEITVSVPGAEPLVHQIRTVVERDDRGEVSGVLSIGRDITEQKRAEEKIRKLNQELEQRVTDRTAQLEAANRELEAFSYSVSHDLRAPLRHIDGFVSLLKKKSAATADEQSQHYMDTISAAVRQMATLIEDLLSFSRMGRGEMTRTQVDLGALLQEILRDFEPETQSRGIDWRVGSLPVVTGDRAMLRIVFVNLISNALKFTQQREQAEIEIGCVSAQEGNETVFFVSDNGVGFDMQYADKLFGVFQRLHGVDEFEGTGIGLANVRRIISRHGGRTWAEGKVDGGATFYFSLPLSD